MPVLASVMINTRQAEAIMNNDFFITVNVFVVVEFLFVNELFATGAAKSTLVGVRCRAGLHVVFRAGAQAGCGDQCEGEDVE